MRNRSIGSSSHGGRCRCADAWNGAPRRRGLASPRARACAAAIAGTGGRTPGISAHLLRRMRVMPATSHARSALEARSSAPPRLARRVGAFRQFARGDVVAALIRRSIGVQTFAPRAGDSGVHLVDAWSARFGEFDEAHLAGLVDGEWPEPARRNIFYSSSILRELGWPAESDRLAGERAALRGSAGGCRHPDSRSLSSRSADALVSPLR